MKRVMLGLFVFVFAAVTAQAHPLSEGVDLASASGRIEIVESGDGFSRHLQVGGQRVFIDGTYRFVSIEAPRGALYLIGLSSGNTVCPAVHAWLHTQGGGSRVTEVFGKCSDLGKVTSDTETVP